MEKNKTEQKVNWKRLSITVGIVLLTALIIGGTTWYFMNLNVKAEKEASDKRIQTLQKQVDELKETKKNSTATKDNTDGWKTYSSSSQGVSFKYPSDWFVEEDTTSLARIYIKNAQGNFTKVTAPSNFQQIWITDSDVESSAQRENNTKAGKPDCCQISSSVTASTINANNILINTYEYTTMGGPSLEAYWVKGDKRYLASCLTEFGAENQQNEVNVLKELLLTIN